MTSLEQGIALVASVLTIASVVLNIIQYKIRRQEFKTLRSQAQTEFNAHFQIARACTRARNSTIADPEKKYEFLLCQIALITGISDVVRTSIISFGREHLDFVPFYEHPAEPGKAQPAYVMYGYPPDVAPPDRAGSSDAAPTK